MAENQSDFAMLAGFIMELAAKPRVQVWPVFEMCEGKPRFTGLWQSELGRYDLDNLPDGYVFTGIIWS